MARRDIDFNDTKSILDGVQKLKKFRTRLILALVSVVSIGIIIIMLIILFGSSIQNIIDQHNSLSGATEDSKQQFAFRNVKITYDERGKMNIEIVQGANESDGGLGGVGDQDPGTPNGEDADGSGGDDSGGNGGGEDAGPEPPKDVDATDESIISFFVGKGYSRNVAIGIAANLKAESGYNISADNGVGNKGIAQWDSGRWSCYQSYLNQIGESDSLGAQLEFVYMEMNNIAPATNQYSNKLSVSNFNSSCKGKYYATKIVAKYYERCGVESNGYKVDWDGTNSSNDSKFINTCQGGQTRLDNASSMN